MDTLTLGISHWGAWRLERSNWTLLNTRDDHAFQLELDSIHTTGQMLDTIFLFSQKSWASREDVGSLVAALDAIFDPRQSLCPGGASRAINATQLLRDRIK